MQWKHIQRVSIQLEKDLISKKVLGALRVLNLCYSKGIVDEVIFLNVRPHKEDLDSSHYRINVKCISMDKKDLLTYLNVILQTIRGVH